MKRLDMKVKPRGDELKGRGRAVRRQGLVPAVIYGAGGPNVAIAVDEKEFRTALRGGDGIAPPLPASLRTEPARPHR